MENIAGWIAPAATMVAAMMTAANLGARFTGWGFVVFLVGSLAWSVVAFVTGQANLLWTNLFLTLVNLVGIWRWLGRQAKYDDGAKVARENSESGSTPALFSIAMLEGQAIASADGATIAHGVGAMAERTSGRIAYLVVREGGLAGVGERLHALQWRDIYVDGDAIRTRLSAEALIALPEVEARQWPARAPVPNG